MSEARSWLCAVSSGKEWYSNPLGRAWALALATWFAGLGHGLLLAATPAPSGQLFDVFPVDEASQHNPVTAIAQTSDGYIWLGTYHGLVRFNGVAFTVFNSGNTEGLENGVITALYEDPNGILWIGHETGHLTRLTAGRFEAASLQRSWRGGAIQTIATDENGDLWLLNDTGALFRCRDGLLLETPGGASPSRKPVLTRAKDGKLWLVSNGSAALLEQGRLAPFQFPDQQPTDFFERVSPARDGGLWVLGNGRIRKWREEHWTSEMPAGPGTPGAVTCLLETHTGALLAGTLRDGLYVLRPGATPLHFSRTNGLSQNWVRALCEDREGNIWLGTSAGFDSLRPRKVQMLDSPDAWQGCGVLSLSVRPDGSAWIGTEGAGLYHYAGGQWTAYRESSGLSNLYIWSVLETRQRELFVGTYGGGLLVRRGTNFVTEGELSQITAPVLALYEGRHGEVWIGTTAGLHRYERGRLTWRAGADRLPVPDVRAITETPDGTLWFGMSGGGLGSLKNGLLRQFGKRNGLGSDFIVALCATADGTLWAGSSDNGLFRVREGRFANIGAAQGLPNNIISQVVDDGEGHLWIGSQAGILRAGREELDRCCDGQLPIVHFISYGRPEGMTSAMCSGGFQPGTGKTADGTLWFPTSKGVALVNIASVSTNPVPPPVQIEQFLVEGKDAVMASTRHRQPTAARARPDLLQTPAPAGNLEILPGRQRFEFRYAGLSFTAPERVRFKYRLEGLEDEWADAGTKRSAQYSYLPPGKYRFRVTACNNDGVWNPAGATLAFTVLPYFYQTLWFRLGSLLGGAGLVGGGVLMATRRRLRRKLELLERQRALERERARIARDIHDDLGASLTRITMLSQSVRGELEGRPEAAGEADQIYATARELTRAMDEIVWAVNPKHDTLDSLVTYLGRFAQHFLSAANIRCRLEAPVNLPAWALTAEVRHSLFLAFKEALHNIVRHAAATEVHVSFQLQADGFVLRVADNGRGFRFPPDDAGHGDAADGARLSPGNGLTNMRKRLEEIGGRCEWDTAPGEGTRVSLAVKV